MEHTVLPPWALVAYLVAGVLFILSLLVLVLIARTIGKRDGIQE